MPHPTASFDPVPASGLDAFDAAAAALRAAGFSLGEPSACSPVPIRHGAHRLGRWADLSPREQGALDGQFWRRGDGTAIAMLHQDAGPAAVAAWAAVLARADKAGFTLRMDKALATAALLALPVMASLSLALAVMP